MPKELPGKTDNKRNLRAGEIQKNLYFPRFLYMGNTGQKEKEGEDIYGTISGEGADSGHTDAERTGNSKKPENNGLFRIFG